MFCKKCGSILLPKKEGNKTILQCPKCGYKEVAEPVEIREQKKKKETEEIAVINEDFETSSVIEADCPKCGNDKAYFWTQQTRAGDEPETKFYKCTKCRHIWRDYS